MNDFEQAFAKRLRQERRRLDLSQGELAAAGGVSLSSQVGYEAGARVPDAAYLHKIEEAGVDTGYLLSGRVEDEAVKAAFYLELVKGILTEINEWEEEHNATVPFEKKLEILHLNFASSIAQRDVDKGGMERLLRLIA